MKTVLTIAGFDPSSGAGITADLMVFAAHGLFGTSAMTGLTVQSTLGVASSHPIPASILAETLACLHADLPAAGIKIGMLATAENVLAVARFITQVRKNSTPDSLVPVVLDPVLRSSSGRELLDAKGLILLRQELLPLVDWVTPNLEELAILTGQPVGCGEDLPRASRSLQQNAASNRLGVLAKGGHLAPPDDYLLTREGREVWLPGTHIATSSTHGTGCALSSAFLSLLVLGEIPERAAAEAKAYVSKALSSATPRGAGAGPMNHLWPLRPL